MIDWDRDPSTHTGFLLPASIRRLESGPAGDSVTPMSQRLGGSVSSPSFTRPAPRPPPPAGSRRRVRRVCEPGLLHPSVGLSVCLRQARSGLGRRPNGPLPPSLSPSWELVGKEPARGDHGERAAQGPHIPGSGGFAGRCHREGTERPAALLPLGTRPLRRP